MFYMWRWPISREALLCYINVYIYSIFCTRSCTFDSPRAGGGNDANMMRRRGAGRGGETICTRFSAPVATLSILPARAEATTRI